MLHGRKSAFFLINKNQKGICAVIKNVGQASPNQGKGVTESHGETVCIVSELNKIQLVQKQDPVRDEPFNYVRTPNKKEMGMNPPVVGLHNKCKEL